MPPRIKYRPYRGQTKKVTPKQQYRGYQTPQMTDYTPPQKFYTPPMTNYYGGEPQPRKFYGKWGSYTPSEQRVEEPEPKFSPTVDRSDYAYNYPATSNLYDYRARYHLPWVTPPMTDYYRGLPKFLQQMPGAPKKGLRPASPPTSGVLGSFTYPGGAPKKTTRGGGGGFYPYYPPGGGGGGGGSDYSYVPTIYPFKQYQPGYAAQGTRSPTMPRFSVASQVQAGYNNSNAVYPARWQQLLTSWRI